MQRMESKGIGQVERSWKRWATAVGGVASVAVLVMTVALPGFVKDESAGHDGGEQYRFNPFGGPEDEERELGEEPDLTEPPQHKAQWIQFLDGHDQPTQAQVVLNAPGMWPYVAERSDALGYLALPPTDTTMMDGQSLQMYEVVARAVTDEEEEHADSYGFWGVVRGPEEAVVASGATQVPMQDAYALELEIVDSEGEPIEGAYIRLSRDSVALVDLRYTTRADGRARFRAIPKGAYYLTLDAQGYSRTTVNIHHSAPMTKPMQLTMDDGAGLRLPHSWRGPPVQELARGGGSSSGSASDASGSGGAGSSGGGRASTSAQVDTGDAGDGWGPMVSVEVYAASDRGSGIEGAWIEAWSDGRRVAQAVSGGRHAQSMRVPAQSEVEFVATHAGWGEGTYRVANVEDGDEVVVRIDGELLSGRVAGDRLFGLDDIEEALEVELVDDDPRWLIELPTGDGAAAKAGFERGDSLLFVRRQGAGHQALVERRGEIQQIAMP